MANRPLTGLWLIVLCAGCGTWDHLARTDKPERPLLAWHRAERPGEPENHLLAVGPSPGTHPSTRVSGIGNEDDGPVTGGVNDPEEPSASATNQSIAPPAKGSLVLRSEVRGDHPHQHKVTPATAVAAPTTPSDKRDLDPPSLIAFVLAIAGVVIGGLAGLLLSIVGFIFGILGLISAGKHDHWGRGFAIAAMIIPIVVLILALLAAENGTR